MGSWSVRRLPSASGEATLVYVDTASGAVHTEPPEEVLAALDMDEDGGDLYPQDDADGPGADAADPSTPRGSSAGASATRTDTKNAAEVDAAEANPEPQFRRIVLGSSHDTPLKMARDLLEAIQEDRSIFSELQRHFSDFPSESSLTLDTLPECLEMQAALLDPGDVSGVLATETGMQILLRVS